MAKNAGDALYATMVFFGVGLIAPRIRTSTAAAIALAFCAAIECSQAYHDAATVVVEDLVELVACVGQDAGGVTYAGSDRFGLQAELKRRSTRFRAPG